MFVNEQAAPQLDNQQPLVGEEKARHFLPTYILCPVYLTYVLMFVNEQAAPQLDNQQPLVCMRGKGTPPYTSSPNIYYVLYT